MAVQAVEVRRAAGGGGGAARGGRAAGGRRGGRTRGGTRGAGAVLVTVAHRGLGVVAATATRRDRQATGGAEQVGHELSTGLRSVRLLRLWIHRINADFGIKRVFIGVRHCGGFRVGVKGIAVY
ncbi:hypothetical protein FLK63_19495 [Burkholderia gladioli]|nr:hypothetical protein [Burkholderia gladioli]